MDNINYNSKIICTYNFFEKEDTELASLCYQMQILQIFNMDKFNNKILQYNIEKIYYFLRDSSKLIDILSILSKKNSQYNIFKFNKEKDIDNNIMIFQLLFSYENFYIFHKYFSKYLNNYLISGEKIDNILEELSINLS
tara:strand:+ start:421 stop:837 length:417 start_codon:yes stop_codon:yes gene_type:complete